MDDDRETGEGDRLRNFGEGEGIKCRENQKKE